MKTKFLILLLAIATWSMGQSVEKNVVLHQDKNSVKVISSSPEGLTLEVSVNNFVKKPLSIKGKEYFLTTLPNESFIRKKGNPELPKICRSITIPTRSGVESKVVSSEFVDFDMPIVPSKGILSRTINPENVEYTFGSTYNVDQFFPAKRVELGEPYLIRNTRGNAITVHPFAYNPVQKKLRVYTKMVIEVSFVGSNLKNAPANVEQKRNNVFEPLLNNHFINREAQLKNTRVVSESGRLLVIAHDDFMDEMQALVDHKNNNGIPTTMVGVSTIGNDATAIYDYIKANYDNDNSLTYVLLVGDKDQVDTKVVKGGGSDPSYSLLSGDDIYPDIIVGRFSGETSDQIKTMVKRSIEYKGLDKSEWMKNGIGIASKEGPGDDNEYDHVHMRNIRTVLLDNQFENVTEFYEGSQGGLDADGNPTASMVAEAINSGASLINYVGHGSVSSWATSGFSKSDINDLTNEEKLPFIFSVACVNGNFTENTCFAESWIRATHNSTGNPTGAMLIYASSINQDWEPPMEAQDNINDMITSETYSVFGVLCYNASCKMMDAYGNTSGSSGANMFLTWNIFGDPTLALEFVKGPHVPVTGVVIDKSTLELNAGKEYKLKAIVSPSNASKKSVTWTSSNESVAKVSNLGVVSAIAEGEAVITATTVDGNISATCDVKVNAFVDDGGEINGGIAIGTMDKDDGNDMWYIDVPEGIATMKVDLSCGAADFDTYGKFNAEPTVQSGGYDWRGYTNGDESNTIENPKAGRHYIMVQYYSGAGEYELSVTLSADRSRSVQEQITKLENDLKIYPNPVNERLSIETPDSDILKVTITDMCGKEFILFEGNAEDVHTVQLSDFASGVYLLKVKTNNAMHTKHILKK